MLYHAKYFDGQTGYLTETEFSEACELRQTILLGDPEFYEEAQENGDVTEEGGQEQAVDDVTSLGQDAVEKVARDFSEAGVFRGDRERVETTV
jgi:hypothetical protein